MQMNKYGQLPKVLGKYFISPKEMMFYQYLPIKMPGNTQPIYEPRLKCFDNIIGAICCDFIGEFGLDKYVESYLYLCAKNLFQSKGCSYNRMGWHCDGFLTDDINYIWSDSCPTIFNNSDFNLTMNDRISMLEMESQALKENDFNYEENQLIRLNQFNVHKVADVTKEGMRTFLKLSFSKDKYDLIGNSKNYMIDYDWQMKERKAERNIPQSAIENVGSNGI